MNGKKLLSISALVLGFAGALQSPVSLAETLDKVVAVVDDDVIMASELSLQTQVLASQIRQAGQQVPPPEYLQRQVLERLIVESLELQLGEHAGVKISDEQLDQAIATIAKQNRMDSATFQQELTRQGIPPAMFRENVRRQIIIQQVQQAMVIKRIDISDQEVDNFLKSEEGRRMASDAAIETPIQQIHARHILIRPTAIRNDADAEALLQKLRSAVERGGDFAALAKKYSEDPGSALKGGDLGWVSPGQMVPEFEKEMVATPIGSTSPPFHSQFGWHIVQVLERREQNMSEQLMRQQAQQILRKRQFQDELPRWLKELRDKAYVQIKL